MIAIGNINASKVYLGGAEVGKIYLGSTQVWGGSSPTPPTPVLPYDAQVEYLEGDGVAFINTGIKAASTVQFECSVYLPTLSDAASILGGRIAVNNSQLMVFCDTTGPNFSWRFGNNSVAVSSVQLSSGDYYLSNILANRTLVLNGNSTSATAATFSTQVDMYIFGYNNNGTPTRNCNGMRFKMGKFFSNGVMVRDYIPVRVGQVGYLYDRVSGELFGNAAGSGGFTVGNDVPTSYDAQVEYLRGTGTQWIDTGIVPQFPDELRFVAEVRYSNVTTRQIMGRQGYFYFGVVSGGLQVSQGGTSTVASISANTFHTIDVTFKSASSAGSAGTTEYSVDGGSTGSLPVSFTNSPANDSVWLFLANDAVSLRGGNDIKSFKIYRSDHLLRDYIPVRVGQTGYLYDKVSEICFLNPGTGSFAYGSHVTT